MRGKVFYTVIAVLYLIAPLFIYKYVSFKAYRDDMLRVEMGVGNINAPKTLEEMNERDVLEQQEKNMTLESYGYLGGAAVCIICPSLLLVFRHKFL